MSAPAHALARIQSHARAGRSLRLRSPRDKPLRSLMDVLLDALGYQARQPHQEDVSTSSTDAHKELLAEVPMQLVAVYLSDLVCGHRSASRTYECSGHSYIRRSRAVSVLSWPEHLQLENSKVTLSFVWKADLAFGIRSCTLPAEDAICILTLSYAEVTFTLSSPVKRGLSNGVNVATGTGGIHRGGRENRPVPGYSAGPPHRGGW
jgi:hypothetical protein